uniref:CapA family protein n=1 Tax=Tessaracoccus timonensis TaxID=2161816 RepID=UPI00131EF140|nr:CapA family protein [Tessaracoccus timonensis]
MSGDLLWHNTLWASAKLDASEGAEEGMDFGPQLASLQPFVEDADLAICHSEVPFAPKGGPYESYPMFAAPPTIASTLKKLGWDLCTTASNHAMDQGWEGLVRTVDDYEAAGIQVAGSYRTEAEASKPVIYTTESGVKVGIVSQTFGLNGIPKAKGKDWSVDIIDADKAIADAKAAKEAGADIVAVHVHAGTEYQHNPDAQQRQFAEAVTASPYVDFVFGQHAHVVQPIDKVNDKWVLYGSGNLIAQSGPSKPWTYDGYMATITLNEQPDGSFAAKQVEWAPTYITRHSRSNPARVYLIPDALAKGEGPAEELKKSASRTRENVTKNKPAGLVERTQ